MLPKMIRHEVLTDYQVYEHSETKTPYLACDDYSVPAVIRSHIDFITPTIHFDAIVTEPRKRRQLPDALGASDTPGSQSLSSYIKKGPAINITHLAVSPNVSPYTLATCYSYITPDCLRALYGLPAGTFAKYAPLPKYPPTSNRFQVIVWYCRNWISGKTS